MLYVIGARSNAQWVDFGLYNEDSTTSFTKFRLKQSGYVEYFLMEPIKPNTSPDALLRAYKFHYGIIDANYKPITKITPNPRLLYAPASLHEQFAVRYRVKDKDTGLVMKIRRMHATFSEDAE